MKSKLLLSLLCLYAANLYADGHKDITFNHRVGEPFKAIGNEVVYQIVVDRFANGDTANDCPADPVFCANADSDSNWYRYQGGDLAGIAQKLSYLHHLGVTRLWLTPIFENLMVSADEPRFGRSAEVTSYHGYWIKDWFRLNPFFTDQGSRDYASLQDLVRKAKGDAGIRLYLDTVANHSSPLTASRWSLDRLAEENPLPLGDGVPRSYRGALFKDGRYVTSYDEDVFRERLEPDYSPYYHHTDRNIGEVHGPSDWDDPYVLEHNNLVGLADFDQSARPAAQYLEEAHDFWLERFPDLAGYRMDTIKHVNNSYWTSFSDHIYGRFPSVEIFGEYYNGGASVPLSVDFYKQTKMSMLDFDFRRALVEVFLDDQSFSLITDVWGRDARLGDASSLYTYLDSHDHPRLRGQGLSYERMRLAIGLWLVSRGIPTIYYGMEQDLFTTNDPGDPYNRPMMRSFDEGHDLFKLMKALIELRRSNTSLRYGDTHVVHETQNIIAFERLHGAKKVFFAASKNRRQGADRFAFQNLSFPDGDYRDVLTGTPYRISGGKMDVALSYGDMIVLQR